MNLWAILLLAMAVATKISRILDVGLPGSGRVAWGVGFAPSVQLVESDNASTKQLNRRDFQTMARGCVVAGLVSGLVSRPP